MIVHKRIRKLEHWQSIYLTRNLQERVQLWIVTTVFRKKNYWKYQDGEIIPIHIIKLTIFVEYFKILHWFFPYIDLSNSFLQIENIFAVINYDYRSLNTQSLSLFQSENERLFVNNWWLYSLKELNTSNVISCWLTGFRCIGVAFCSRVMNLREIVCKVQIFLLARG